MKPWHAFRRLLSSDCCHPRVLVLRQEPLHTVVSMFLAAVDDDDDRQQQRYPHSKIFQAELRFGYLGTPRRGTARN
eukprot:10688364-Lingulodinium_polyedra.AAC.1